MEFVDKNRGKQKKNAEVASQWSWKLLIPLCMQLEIYPTVAVQWLRSCFPAGLGTVHPGAFHSVSVAVTTGGFMKTGTETKNLKGWCSSFVLWLCRLSEEQIHRIQNFWIIYFDLSTFIYLFFCKHTNALPLMENITNWWNARSRSKSHLILGASKHEPYYEDIDAIEFVTPLSDRGSDSSLSDVTCNDFWNTSLRFISKFLSYCYACKIVSTWTYLTLVINLWSNKGEAGWKCHIQHSLFPSAAKNLLAV